MTEHYYVCMTCNETAPHVDINGDCMDCTSEMKLQIERVLKDWAYETMEGQG